MSKRILVTTIDPVMAVPFLSHRRRGGDNGQGPLVFKCHMSSPFVVSLSNHERTALRQAQGERDTNYDTKMKRPWRNAFRLAMLGAALVLAATVVAACGSSTTPVEPDVSPPTATAAAPADSPAPTEAPAAEARSVGEVDGVTFAVGEGSKVTFYVREELASVPLPFDAEVSTTALTGEIHLDGRDSVIEIDLQSLSSDNSFRDRYIQERMFGQHPTGVVTVKGMSELPSGFTGGETVTTEVESELLIREVTTPLTFEVEARDEGSEISITGTHDVHVG